MAASQLELTQKRAEREGVTNIICKQGNMAKLPYEDNQFGLIFCHAFLMYMPDIPAVLTEMKRVLKPGGYICCREPDFTDSVLSPANTIIEQAELIRFKASLKLGMDCFCGLKLEDSALKAKLKIIKLTHGSEVFEQDTLQAIFKWLEVFWRDSELRQLSLKENLVTPEQIDTLLGEIMPFPQNPKAFYRLPYTEIICQKTV